MLTLIGQVVTPDGLVLKHDRAGEAVPYQLRANSYFRDQPWLPLHFDHDRTWQIGQCEYLERSRSTGLMMVGRIPDDSMGDFLAEHGPWYLSDSVDCRPIGTTVAVQGRLRELSLVRSSANLNTRPVAWSRIDIAMDGGAQPPMPLPWRSCWDRAHQRMSTYAWRKADRLTVHDVDRLDVVDEVLTDPVAARRRAAVVDAHAATAPAAAKPPPKPQPSHAGQVRFEGAWLSPELSARFNDLLEDGCSLDTACRLIRASA